MVQVIFVAQDGARRPVDAPVGYSVMEAAIDHNIPGIDGDCGGACACATCHVHVDKAWLAKLPPMSELERGMLDFAFGVDELSRLACQIKLAPELDGLVVHTPEQQY
ncbi:MAG: 2Fe-2S iron-sulfur cluster binding domain-containing protein [Alphaproteobacteria bacterium]|nr:2Fe-2S iron-sulfur cluster binding domain-containing protein [Alphaproteobacteria bacterium]MDE2012198.1 2Fe-2S iron-sulfur cluster binding domain-containing protein [Alphaproteobacteria bacterium]MDE2074585.1 2Fe-2S iron-sulfur cluster binding domain-containing protein [Alphaproteobacteria bacterium]MDE2350422.1 2Fe-2S iron-sulfur cluster binding domain-containing protein [Alphaproteobacteria bacterium]